MGVDIAILRIRIEGERGGDVIRECECTRTGTIKGKMRKQNEWEQKWKELELVVLVGWSGSTYCPREETTSGGDASSSSFP